MKYISILVVIYVLLPESWSCKTVEELDQCAYEINFLANRDLSIPTNDGEMLQVCDKSKASLKCLSDHAKECSKGSIRSIITKVMNELEGHLNRRCSKAEDRIEFMKNVQCFTDKSKIDAIRFCSDKFMVMMEKASDLPKSLRLGGTCCTSHIFRKCVLDEINTHCDSEAANYFNDLIDEIVQENVQLVCKEFSDLDKCEANYNAATWSELKEIMNSNDKSLISRHKYKTIVPIIIKLLREAK